MDVESPVGLSYITVSLAHTHSLTHSLTITYIHHNRAGKAPLLDLDDKAYKLVQQLEQATQGGAPSLVGAERVTIKVGTRCH